MDTNCYGLNVSPGSSYFEILTSSVMVLRGRGLWELHRAHRELHRALGQSPHNGISTPTREDTHQISLSLHSVPCEDIGRWSSANPEVGSHHTQDPPTR